LEINFSKKDSRAKNQEFLVLTLDSCFFYLPLNMNQDQKKLIQLAHTIMPFGKYEGRYLIDLPEYYMVWYSNKGFPKGQLGEQLQLVYELKLNGLEELIRNIKKHYPKKDY
jgi:uncharacterized protein